MSIFPSLEGLSQRCFLGRLLHILLTKTRREFKATSCDSHPLPRIGIANQGAEVYDAYVERDFVQEK